MANPTIWAAWLGAVTGIASLAWNVYVKLSSGPRLYILANARMILKPSPPHKPKFLRIAVRNVGTAPTTITNYSIHTYEDFRFRRTDLNATLSAVLNHYSGPQTPTKLAIGDEVNILMEQDEKFADEWLSADLWVGVHHAFKRTAVMAKVVKGPED